MQLTERHMIKNGSPYYERCDELSFLSKNLYNEMLYLVRQRFFETGEFVRYATLNHELSKQCRWTTRLFLQRLRSRP